MLTEKQIQALQNGAYGVTRDGKKVKYIGETLGNCHLWIAYYKDNKVGDVLLTRFDKYFDDDIEHRLDIIGLWKDYKEPFNLKRALEGEFIVTPYHSNRIRLVGKSAFETKEDCYVIEYENDDPVIVPLKVLTKNFYMEKKPEPVTLSTEDLPKPIREFGDLEKVWEKVWVINFSVTRVEYFPAPLYKREKWVKFERIALKNGLLYKSKEDCQAVCDWLMSR